MNQQPQLQHRSSPKIAIVITKNYRHLTHKKKTPLEKHRPDFAASRRLFQRVNQPEPKHYPSLPVLMTLIRQLRPRRLGPSTTGPQHLRPLFSNLKLPSGV
ncbi:unnamed protein product [Lactuca virosa]|uniref:Uncharacterized protein n=1 Tax=Lactuca virosa TaxID=75947 RepID=A0AAU9NAS5_9ASTR|nr:unnamed protein product [Lactuca virosa]